MNTQPKHDAETGDLQGSAPLVAKSDDSAIGDLPNSDTATDDMRGHEPAPETDAESDHTKMIVGAVFAVVLIGGIVSYATGLWNTAPPAPAQPARVAAIVVPAPLPAVVPQPAVVPAPVQAAPAAEVEAAPPVPVHVAKRTVAPRPAMRAQPKPVIVPAETAPIETVQPMVTPATTAPEGATGGLPTPPATEPAAQVLPDQPVPPAPAP